MERLLTRSLTTITVVIAVLALVAAVYGNTPHPPQLPSSASLLGCANCHEGATTTEAPSHKLTSFGQAFLENGKVWDRALAEKDSDGDGCLNGVELGDADGNGLPDGGQTQQTSNPGTGNDCHPSTIDEQTWGALKSLFNCK